jgi:hypothetical protein
MTPPSRVLHPCAHSARTTTTHHALSPSPSPSHPNSRPIRTYACHSTRTTTRHHALSPSPSPSHPLRTHVTQLALLRDAVRLRRARDHGWAHARATGTPTVPFFVGRSIVCSPSLVPGRPLAQVQTVSFFLGRSIGRLPLFSDMKSSFLTVVHPRPTHSGRTLHTAFVQPLFSLTVPPCVVCCRSSSLC